MEYYAGIDVGGTKIYAVIINENGDILGRAKVKTGHNTEFDKVLEKILTCYHTACSNSKVDDTQISTIGLAVPSSIDPRDRKA